VRLYQSARVTWVVRSPHRSVRSLLVGVVGVIAGFFAIAAIDAIDGAGSTTDMNSTQTVINLIAVFIGLVMMVGSVVWSIRRTRRIAVLGNDELLVLPGRRPIFVALTAIRTVTVGNSSPSSRQSCVLELDNGVTVPVPRSRDPRGGAPPDGLAVTARPSGRAVRSAADVAGRIRSHLTAPPADSVPGRPSVMATVATTGLTFSSMAPSPATTPARVTAPVPPDAVVTVDARANRRPVPLSMVLVFVVWIAVIAAIITSTGQPLVLLGPLAVAVAVGVSTAVRLSVREVRVGPDWLAVRSGRTRWRVIRASDVVCVRSGSIASASARRGSGPRAVRFYDATGRVVALPIRVGYQKAVTQAGVAFGARPVWTRAARDLVDAN
jgi:hypothetical protein